MSAEKHSAGRGHPSLEIWGGLECTFNRVHDRYFNQIEMTGHAARPEDLDAIAALGLRTLRYPVLWETVCSLGPNHKIWSFPDERLARMRELGIRPIAGLMHHGSGPTWTSLIDPGFPRAFSAYAASVAERYPWVDAFTPVNEPLTTARFSGLYGHWFPHLRSERAFLAILVAQCKASMWAMRAIRKSIPQAKFIATEDLAKTHAKPPLAYQADFENERRWLSCDLLCGKVDNHHYLWRHLLEHGILERDLRALAEESVPPDILGFNYYLTGERFLDPRLDRYPECYHGGNGRHSYADVEAVRVHEARISGAGNLLRDAWERYGKPLAVTEAHLGCTREDQVRWLREIWIAAQGLKQEGVDIRAVTAWSLFGACEWNSLVTRLDGHYEPGAFDVRAPSPRPTALAGLIACLAAGHKPSDPVSADPGWWHRTDRFFAASTEPITGACRTFRVRTQSIRPILITGGDGTLARVLANRCRKRGLRFLRLSRAQMDVADTDSVKRAINNVRPWAILNAAGYVRVEDAENEPEKCLRENTLGPAVLAEACDSQAIRLLTFSSDLVFNGHAVRPYLESDPVSPPNLYGRSKAEAERRVLAAAPGSLVVRTGAFFGPGEGSGFLVRYIEALRTREPLMVAEDITVSPTYLPGLADVCLDLLLDGESGVWHLANSGAMTWADLARFIARALGYGEESVLALPSRILFPNTPGPRYSALSSERGRILPSVEKDLERCLGELSGMAVHGR